MCKMHDFRGCLKKKLGLLVNFIGNRAGIVTDWIHENEQQN